MEIKRNYKDGMFRRLFSDRERLIELYNALSGSNYGADTPVEIMTLDDAIFGDIKNDVCCLIDHRFILMTEHQSTVNPNMPLRMLSYAAREYERGGFTRNLYSRRLMKIPTPELYVLYNGTEEQPLERQLKLSDAFVEKCDKINIEIKVEVININYEKGSELLSRSRTLKEYSRFIHMIRERQDRMSLKEAVEETVSECMKEGILEEFLRKNGGYIMDFVNLELTREECEAIREEDGYMRGLEEGIAEGINEGKEKEQLKIARNMKEMGAEIGFIAKAVGLTEKEVEAL